MSLRAIFSPTEEIYGMQISHTVLSEITARIIPDIKAWQNRPLEALYCIVWMDAMHYKVRINGKIEHRALYIILGINKEGKKEISGMYISQS
jgi:transposase-like protein